MDYFHDDYVVDCCRGEKKPTPTVSVVSSVQETRDSCARDSHVGKEVTSGTVTNYQPAVSGSPSKRLSPADVSGTNEEWETASEGSDGGLHPRRQTTHKDSVESSSADAVKPDSGSAVLDCTARLSPCTSGVPSLAAVSDLEHSWKDASLFQCHADLATQHDLSVTGLSATTNTDCANVGSPSLAPGSRLFPASFSDPGTKQPSVHDSLARFLSTLCDLNLLTSFAHTHTHTVLPAVFSGQPG